MNNQTNYYIPYIWIRIYNQAEVTKIINQFPQHYFISRDYSPYEIIIVGGMLIKDRKDVRKATKQLEAEVKAITSFSYSILDCGILPLQSCKRILKNEKLEENPYYYISFSIAYNQVEVFSLSFDKKEVYYLTRGELVDHDLVIVQ